MRGPGFWGITSTATDECACTGWLTAASNPHPAQKTLMRRKALNGGMEQKYQEIAGASHGFQAWPFKKQSGDLSGTTGNDGSQTTEPVRGRNPVFGKGQTYSEAYLFVGAISPGESAGDFLLVACCLVSQSL